MTTGQTPGARRPKSTGQSTGQRKQPVSTFRTRASAASIAGACVFAVVSGAGAVFAGDWWGQHHGPVVIQFVNGPGGGTHAGTSRAAVKVTAPAPTSPATATAAAPAEPDSNVSRAYPRATRAPRPAHHPATQGGTTPATTPSTTPSDSSSSSVPPATPSPSDSLFSSVPPSVPTPSAVPAGSTAPPGDNGLDLAGGWPPARSRLVLGQQAPSLFHAPDGPPGTSL